MAEAKKDNNSVDTLIATLNTSALTPTGVKINPTNNSLKVIDGTTGSDFGGTIAGRDNNSVPVMMAVSSADNTPIVLYCDSNGQLLVQTT